MASELDVLAFSLTLYCSFAQPTAPVNPSSAALFALAVPYAARAMATNAAASLFQYVRTYTLNVKLWCGQWRSPDFEHEHETDVNLIIIRHLAPQNTFRMCSVCTASDNDTNTARVVLAPAGDGVQEALRDAFAALASQFGAVYEPNDDGVTLTFSMSCSAKTANEALAARDFAARYRRLVH